RVLALRDGVGPHVAHRVEAGGRGDVGAPDTGVDRVRRRGARGREQNSDTAQNEAYPTKVMLGGGCAMAARDTSLMILDF
ncbi:MAG: hypothetical protein QOI98_2461, partial [Solirubrobacteraceae bacterium]|nr:hypothetical protein [Solirubrobacteraceae bacterium]